MLLPSQALPLGWTLGRKVPPCQMMGSCVISKGLVLSVRPGGSLRTGLWSLYSNASVGSRVHPESRPPITGSHMIREGPSGLEVPLGPAETLSPGSPDLPTATVSGPGRCCEAKRKTCELCSPPTGRGTHQRLLLHLPPGCSSCYQDVVQE